MNKDGGDGDFGQVPGTPRWRGINEATELLRQKRRQLDKQKEVDNMPIAGEYNYKLGRITDQLDRIEKKVDDLIREKNKPVVLPVAATNEPRTRR